MENTLLSLEPYANFAYAFMGTILVAMIVWGIMRGVTYLTAMSDIKLTDSMRQTLESTLNTGVNYAMQFAIDKIKDATDGKLTIDVKHEAIKVGAEYVFDKVPGALEHFGITYDGVVNRLEARWNIDLDGDGDIGIPNGAI